MGAYCVIGHADIGPEVMMGSRVSIPSGKRQHFDDSGQISSATRFDTVRIGRKCWIGEGAIILSDVGSGCIVSAGAVVIKSVPDRCIVGGNPAQVIKELS
jgi:acetyltransferase-like isoleucine patch superfamily enzyme